MILRAFIYALAVFLFTGLISLAVAGIIKLIYKSVHKNEPKKEVKPETVRPAAQRAEKEPNL